MPIIEAMSCGAPVVCSDAASMPEAGGEIAAKIAPLDVGGWTEKFREFAQSEQESSDHAKRREIHLRKFTWSAAADQTFEMYKEVG
jgi:alpha-1,3-rhamnosyl/mannosyltransferase